MGVGVAGLGVGVAGLGVGVTGFEVGVGVVGIGVGVAGFGVDVGVGVGVAVAGGGVGLALIVIVPGATLVGMDLPSETSIGEMMALDTVTVDVPALSALNTYVKLTLFTPVLL